MELLAQHLQANCRGALRLVVLEACEGARPSEFASAAERLVRAGADAVVAHLWSVRADVARVCSAQLYRALAGAGRHGGDVARAVNEARRAMLVAFGESAEALSPVLYLRGTDEVIFDFAGGRVDPVFGKEPLPLKDKAGPAALLNARHRVVPFHGREDMLGEMRGWCEGGESVGVRLIHAAGGMGKTRLAIELCRKMRERGWRAGFLERGEQLDALVESEEPVLAVIDYAESRPGLREVLRRVPGRRQGKLRLILLARNADEWWAYLLRSDGVVTDLLSEVEPIELQAVASDREALFLEAVRALAKARRKTVPEGAMPSLSDVRYKRALYVHMAALAVVEGPGEVEADTLLKYTLDHEERFWQEQLRERGHAGTRLALPKMRQAVAALTLIGGVDSAEESQKLVGDEELALLLRDLYPGSTTQHISGLEPDLLGEAMVWRVLSEDGAGAGPYLDRVFDGAGERAIRAGFEVLGRLSVDHEEADGWLARVLRRDVAGRAMAAFAAAKSVGKRTAHAGLGLVLAEALKQEGTVEIAERLEAELPHPERTVSLREVGRWVLETRLAHLLEGSDEERARLLNNLSVWQSALGQREAALTSTLEAVVIRRRLAEARPDALYLPPSSSAWPPSPPPSVSEGPSPGPPPSPPYRGALGWPHLREDRRAAA